ncbi:MAG: hypothetical protein IPJ40_21340 [Saprospirales bacterium]|nr:hypothetical protein [Saprospirales bacterium]
MTTPFQSIRPQGTTDLCRAFREQVLHHALMNICHPYFERVQIFDSYANQAKALMTLDRAKTFTRRYRFF